jgi:hypothetical protein
MKMDAVIPFQSGSPILLAGPTNSGKTRWVSRFLTYQMFTEKIASIHYFYGVYDNFYTEMKKSSTVVAPIFFKKGLPSEEDINHIADGKFHILVLDDLMDDIVKSVEMLQLFTKYCHHKNISAIFISQNIFQQGKYSRTISINCHVIVLFANKRDESQITTFARQIYPHAVKKFLNIYTSMMKKEYAYIVIDCTPAHPRQIKIRGDIFPGEHSFTYDI